MGLNLPNNLANNLKNTLTNNSVSSGVPIPDPTFQVDFDDSIVPEIGSAGTFERASERTYWVDADTMGVVSSGNPAIPAFQQGMSTPATGYAMYSGTANLADESGDLTTWDAIGTPTITPSAGEWFDYIDYSTLVGDATEGV